MNKHNNIIDELVERINLDYVDHNALRREIQRLLGCDYDVAMNLVWRFLCSGLDKCWNEKKRAYSMRMFWRRRQQDRRIAYWDLVNRRHKERFGR